MSNHNPIVTIFTFVAIVFHCEWHALCCTMSLVRFTNELFANMPYDHTKTVSICEILNVAYVFLSLSFLNRTSFLSMFTIVSKSSKIVCLIHSKKPTINGLSGTFAHLLIYLYVDSFCVSSLLQNSKKKGTMCFT